ncbi:MFS transporter [bacterium]|nr:MAG: MFS transporter [bacterium]
MTAGDAPNVPARAADRNRPDRKRPAPILAIFLTVLIDMLGFAMFIPDLQLRGEGLVRNALGLAPGVADPRVGLLIGLQIAAFSLAQLLLSPWLGRLSDRHGRRLVLRISSALAVVAYLVYAFAPSLPFLVLSRALSGVAAANLGVAFAYVSDVTEPKDRSKSLGLLGAAFGIGFIIGPSLGALLLRVSGDSPVLLGSVAATLALINFLFIQFLVPESLPAERRSGSRRFLADLRVAFGSPTLRLLLVVFFMIQLGFTGLETTFFRLLERPDWIFHYGRHAKDVGAYVLGAVGITAAIMQGGVIRRLPPGTDDRAVLRWAYLLFIPALALVPFTPLWFPGILVSIALGIANGLAQPTLSGLISRNAPVTILGGIFGITQALGALARVLGPLLGNPLFELRPWLPYVAGAGLACVPAFLVWTTKLSFRPAGTGEGDATPVH